MDPVAGVCGLIAVSTVSLAAYLIGFNRFNIRSGFYGFNALLVGLGIGVHFQFTPELFLLLVFASLLTLFLTLFIEGMIGKYGLPFLTFPFLLGFWLVIMAARRYSGLDISERGIFTYNEFFLWGGSTLVDAHNWLKELALPEAMTSYFKSLSAIFFQYHLFPGILIALGLLYSSRIAFLLSLLGYYSAYVFYQLIGANLNELNYSYIGFNFILTSIAIGGFFIISSRTSFLWVVLLTPVISIILSGTTELLSYFQLSTYSLPFNFVVIVFLFMLRFREKQDKKLELVIFQEFSPERNLYNQQNSKIRFHGNQYLPIGLPMLGEWIVTQGHSGEHTHKDAWKHAWDFEIVDHQGKSYSGNGTSLSDYYCYNKPVVAPADGWIEEVISQVEDNAPGSFNLEQNWGNTIVMRHADGLFSKMSHLRKGSITVDKGMFVKCGEVIASTGNSGRSPRPHLHFQIQSNPYVGSNTLDYPLARYITRTGEQHELLSWGIPAKDHFIAGIASNPCLTRAFTFTPGQQLTFRISNGDKLAEDITWEVMIDLFNYTFLYCQGSNSKAYFHCDKDLFYFTSFHGDRNSLLFSFYLGAYKVSHGFSRGLQIRDEFPLYTIHQGVKKVLQDFIAPFHIFIRSEYRMVYVSMGDELGQNDITLKSVVTEKTAFSEATTGEFTFKVLNDQIEQFFILRGGIKTVADRLPNP